MESLNSVQPPPPPIDTNGYLLSTIYLSWSFCYKRMYMLHKLRIFPILCIHMKDRIVTLYPRVSVNDSPLNPSTTTY